MQSQSPEIILSQSIINDVSSIDAMQLIDAGHGAQIISSTAAGQSPDNREAAITSHPFNTIENQKTRLFTIPQAGQHRGWDAAINPEGCWLIVYEKAGKSGNDIFIKGSNLPETPVSPAFPFEGFSSPRFIKNRHGDPGRYIIAVAEDTSSVLFSREADGGYDIAAKLCDCSYAAPVEYRDGYLLFYKTNIEAAPGSSHASPGRLRAIRLEKDFNITGQIIEPFKDRDIIEFDVDVSDNEIFVFATSQTGAALAYHVSQSGGFHIASFDKDVHGNKLRYPSILAARGHLYLSVLNFPGTDKARLMTGSLPIDLLRSR